MTEDITDKVIEALEKLPFQLELGKEFQIKYYEMAKYTAYLEKFIEYLKKKKLRKGYKKFPKDFYNSYEWAEVRIIVLRRDSFKCFHCGNLANHVDHINSAKYFPEMALDPTNLISTCHKCHEDRHGIIIKNKK